VSGSLQLSDFFVGASSGRAEVLLDPA